MKTISLLGLIAVAGALLGCSAMFSTYRSDMWDGKRLMDSGEYGKARDEFLKAAKAEPAAAAPYAFAATASYKMNDLEGASGFMTEATKRDKYLDAHVRILGYRSPYPSERRQAEGRYKALNEYSEAYGKDYGVDDLREVRTMVRQNRMDLVALEHILDGQIRTYESDLEQYQRSGTGWLAQRYGTPTAAIGGSGNP